MDARRVVRFGLLFAVMVNMAYLRGFDIDSVTSSYLVVVWVIGGAVLVFAIFAKTGSTMVTGRWWPWVGLVAWTCVSFMFNLVVRPHSMLTIQFMIEMLLNFMLFLVFLYLLDEELLEELYRKFLIVSAGAGAVLLAYPTISGANSVRRVGGYELPGAVNNISTMLAVGVVIAVVGIVTADDWRNATVEWIALPLVTIGVFLSASRAAIIGLVISFGVLVLASNIDLGQAVAAGSAFVLMVGAVLGALYDFSGLYRFSLAGLQDAVSTRLVLYRAAIQQSGTDPVSLIFGGGMYRYSKIAGPDAVTPFNNIIYPHNYVISLLVHVGLPAALLFGIAFLWNGRSLVYFTLEGEELDYVATTTLLSLIVVSMYVFTSGRITRTFALWVVLGISEFLYASRVLDVDPKTQLAEFVRGSRSTDGPDPSPEEV